MNPGEVSNLVGDMDDDFHGNTYHLLDGLSLWMEALCFELTGKRRRAGSTGWRGRRSSPTRARRAYYP